jgi:hypothetical protein
LFRYEIQNGGYGRTFFKIGPHGKKVLKGVLSVREKGNNCKIGNEIYFKIAW